MTKNFKRPPEFYPPIIALKGTMTAAEVGAKFGLTKNAVIGIWNRAKAPSLDMQQRFEMQSRGSTVAWERRKSGGA